MDGRNRAEPKPLLRLSGERVEFQNSRWCWVVVWLVNACLMAQTVRGLASLPLTGGDRGGVLHRGGQDPAHAGHGLDRMGIRGVGAAGLAT